MGNTSEELKEVVKKQEKDGRYYLIRVKEGDMVPSGWLCAAPKRTYFTEARVLAHLEEAQPNRSVKNTFYSRWYMYPGKKPDKRWGPVCP